MLMLICTNNLSQASTVRFGIIHYFIYIIIHSGLKNFMDACEFSNEFICKFIQSNNQWIHQFIQTNNLSQTIKQPLSDLQLLSPIRDWKDKKKTQKGVVKLIFKHCSVGRPVFSPKVWLSLPFWDFTVEILFMS